MGFTIQNQNAGIINNVEGEQHIRAPQHGTAVALQDARSAAQDLHRLLEREAVTSGDPALAGAAEDAGRIEAEMAAPDPDRGRVSRLLERVTSVLAAGGALVTATSPLVAPLRELVLWAGAHAAPLLAMLPL
jgi:hypothetical protein